MDLRVFFTVAFGLFGLLFGSFANVVIWRVPRGESIVSPGSHCPGCNKPIVWYDNIPVLSWLLLKGRCRACGQPISARYPIIEAASGVLFVTAAIVFGPTARGAFAAWFFWFLLVLTAIDIDCMRLPNPLVGALAILGVLGILYASMAGEAAVPLVGVAREGSFASPAASAALGVALGAGLSLAVATAYGALRGKSGLGMGDVKLLGALGIFLGPYVLVALFLASVAGAIFGVLASRGGRLAEKRIPFGPWLALGGLMTAITGPAIVGWYLRVSGLA